MTGGEYTRRVSMLLFAPPSSFESYGEHPCDPNNLSYLLAGLIVIVSVGALALILCRAVLMLLVGEPLLSKSFAVDRH